MEISEPGIPTSEGELQPGRARRLLSKQGWTGRVFVALYLWASNPPSFKAYRPNKNASASGSRPAQAPSVARALLDHDLQALGTRDPHPQDRLERAHVLDRFAVDLGA